MIHSGDDDSYWVVFPIPTVYRTWFELFCKFRSMGHTVLSRHWEDNSRPAVALIRFDTFTDALEFELKHL
jgi:hypothetical protein